MLKKQNKTIAIAESCTGGLIGNRLTDIPGSSQYFKGGIIAYQNSIKEEQLAVKAKTLESFGAVSKECALEMAKGARNKLHSHIGLSSTGIAGPEGETPSKPVGLVYVAIADRDTQTAQEFYFSKNRQRNKLMTSQAALHMLFKHLSKKI